MSQKYRKGSGRSPAEDEGHKDRMHLLDSNVKLIVQAYLDGKSNGMDHPVVFVVDIRDKVGEQIARPLLGDERAAALKAKLNMQRLIPTSVFAVPASLAPSALEGHSPRSAEQIKQTARAGGIPVVAVASGGTLLANLQLPTSNKN
jgi:hypothetical protein